MNLINEKKWNDERVGYVYVVVHHEFRVMEEVICVCDVCIVEESKQMDN